jgi:hypothetical protein
MLMVFRFEKFEFLQPNILRLLLLVETHKSLRARFNSLHAAAVEALIYDSGNVGPPYKGSSRWHD